MSGESEKEHSVVLDKRISVGNIITALPLLIGIAIVWGQNSNRMDNFEIARKEDKEGMLKLIEEAKSTRDRQIFDMKTAAEKQAEDARNSIVQIQQANISFSERLVRLEVRVDYMGAILAKIDSKIPDPDSVDMRRKN